MQAAPSFICANRAGQLLHRLPLAPHADCAVPATHVPPLAAVQQPPLQGVLVLQALPHVCTLASQA